MMINKLLSVYSSFSDRVGLKVVINIIHRRRNRGTGGRYPHQYQKWGGGGLKRVAAVSSIWVIVQHRPRHRCNAPIKNTSPAILFK